MLNDVFYIQSIEEKARGLRIFDPKANEAERGFSPIHSVRNGPKGTHRGQEEGQKTIKKS